MPESALQSVRRTARSVAVWFAWFLLTGYLTHDRTYGELKRLEAVRVVKRLSVLASIIVVLGWFLGNMPLGAAVWVGSGLLLGAGFGLFVVGGYFAITWYADYSLGR